MASPSKKKIISGKGLVVDDSVSIRLLEFIASKHVFLPGIGHVSQSTPEPVCARGRSDKVYETVTGAITVYAD
jgi:hypothetical protein